jgi:hypothetical protein
MAKWTPDSLVHCEHTQWKWVSSRWGSCKICETGQYAPLVQYSRNKSLGNGQAWLLSRQAKIRDGMAAEIGVIIEHNGVEYKI